MDIYICFYPITQKNVSKTSVILYMKNICFKLWTTDKCLYKDGYAIWLVVRKDGKRKAFSLGIYAYPHQ